MNCPICKTNYLHPSRQKSVPRVLVVCGHTFCEQCLDNQLKSSTSKIIQCVDCKKELLVNAIGELPINYTLISLIQKGMQAQSDLCKVHKLKMQLLCEKDNEMLCLQCIINGLHKNHKYASITEVSNILVFIQKAKKDREILKQSLFHLDHSISTHVQTTLQIQKCHHQIQQEYKDALLDLAIFYKNIHQEIYRLELLSKEQINGQMQEQVRHLEHVEINLKQKITFMQDLKNIYHQLESMNDIQYLNQENKRFFILQNCKQKRDSVVTQPILFRKIDWLDKTIKSIEELIVYEKKCLNNNQIANTALPPRQSKKIVESPMKRKSSQKEPAILEVNLNDQYKRHMELKINKQSDSKSNKAFDIIRRDKNKSNVEKLVRKDTLTTRQIKENTLQKNELQWSQSSRSHPIKDSISLIHEEIFPEDNNNFSALNSIQSFMRSSRNSIQDHSCENILGNLNFNQENIENLSNTSPVKFENHHEVTIKSSWDGQESFSKVSNPQVIHVGGICSDNSFEIYNNEHQQSSMVVHGKNGKLACRNKMQCLLLDKIKKYLIIGGKSNINGDRTKQMAFFDPISMKIEAIDMKLKEQRSGFGSVVLGNEILIFGGSTSKGLATNSCERYLIQNNEIIGLSTKVSGMIQCRDEVGFCLGMDGNVYAGGGVNTSNNVVSSCERYNIISKKWEQLPSMRIARRSFAMVALPNGVYAIGGHDGKKYLNETQFYSYEGHQWTQVGSINESRCGLTAIVSPDYQTLTIFGGFRNNPLDSIEIYNISKDSWKVCEQKMKAKRYMHCTLPFPF